MTLKLTTLSGCFLPRLGPYPSFSVLIARRFFYDVENLHAYSRGPWWPARRWKRASERNFSFTRFISIYLGTRQLAVLAIRLHTMEWGAFRPAGSFHYRGRLVEVLRTPPVINITKNHFALLFLHLHRTSTANPTKKEAPLWFTRHYCHHFLRNDANGRYSERIKGHCQSAR